MNLVDANVLLYAVNASDPKHAGARAWLDHALGDRETLGLPWISLLAFLRLSTRAGLFPRPLPVAVALDVVRSWASQPPSMIVHPTPRHLDLMSGLLAPLGAGGNLVSDAHLAALALEHDATVVTYDSDFGRFPGLRWVSPTP